MDRLTIVIIFVGGIALAALLGIIGLSGFDKPVPDILENVGIAALTGLVGLLVPAREPGEHRA